jgi:hypothetical protein
MITIATTPLTKVSRTFHHQNITEILLKVVLNTITLTHIQCHATVNNISVLSIICTLFFLISLREISIINGLTMILIIIGQTCIYIMVTQGT